MSEDKKKCMQKIHIRLLIFLWVWLLSKPTDILVSNEVTFKRPEKQTVKTDQNKTNTLKDSRLGIFSQQHKREFSQCKLL